MSYAADEECHSCRSVVSWHKDRMFALERVGRWSSISALVHAHDGVDLRYMSCNFRTRPVWRADGRYSCIYDDFQHPSQDTLHMCGVLETTAVKHCTNAGSQFFGMLTAETSVAVGDWDSRIDV